MMIFYCTIYPAIIQSYFYIFHKKEDGNFPVLFSGLIYLMLPYSLTVIVVSGIAVVSLDTVILPSNISFTRAL